MPNASKKVKRVATLEISSPGKMTNKERSDIAVWMMKQARHLLVNGNNYTLGRFIAGLNYHR